jgi:hypothetical protein
MGAFVRDILKRRHIKLASVARAMEISPGTMNGYLDQQKIGDTILVNMTGVLGFDLIGMVQAEVKRLATPPSRVREINREQIVQEPASAYGIRSTDTDDADDVVVMVKLNRYAPAEQDELMRFLRQLPKRSRTRSTGS